MIYKKGSYCYYYYYRYGRDYYINVEKELNRNRNQDKSPTQSLNQLEEQVSRHPSSPLLCELERDVLRQDLYHASFRSRQASPHFMLNPLYEPQGDDDDHEDTNSDSVSVQPTREASDTGILESGYESSQDSFTEHNRSDSLRLNRPKPEVVIETMESLATIRRTNSLRLPHRKTAKENLVGGSLRIKSNSRLSMMW